MELISRGNTNLCINRFKKSLDQFMDNIKTGHQEKKRIFGRCCYTLCQHDNHVFLLASFVSGVILMNKQKINFSVLKLWVSPLAITVIYQDRIIYHDHYCIDQGILNKTLYR